MFINIIALDLEWYAILTFDSTKASSSPISLFSYERRNQ